MIVKTGRKLAISSSNFSTYLKAEENITNYLITAVDSDSINGNNLFISDSNMPLGFRKLNIEIDLKYKSSGVTYYKRTGSSDSYTFTTVSDLTENPDKTAYYTTSNSDDGTEATLNNFDKTNENSSIYKISTSGDAVFPYKFSKVSEEYVISDISTNLAVSACNQLNFVDADWTVSYDSEHSKFILDAASDKTLIPGKIVSVTEAANGLEFEFKFLFENQSNSEAQTMNTILLHQSTTTNPKLLAAFIFPAYKIAANKSVVFNYTLYF